MKTLDELVYYCKESQPVGALMLTGEWGSGKTYLLDHQLKKTLTNSHILVRVSLFGIDSVEALHNAVKLEWAKMCSPLFSKMHRAKNRFPFGKAAADFFTNFIPQLNDIKDAVLAIDPLDFITISPDVGIESEKKTVVLIFDDLERSKLDTIDVLGCINEYCENRKFKTIIVANEDKIPEKSTSGEESGISYLEIKEKIVARTVSLVPDYKKVIDSVIRERTWGTEEYTAFLLNNLELIHSTFVEDATNPSVEETAGLDVSIPHNIRSLKCALQDFSRLYPQLVSAGLPDLSKYLYSFVAYTMAAKSGLIDEGEYGDLLSPGSVKKLYPLYSDNTMFPIAKHWITHGAWDDEEFRREIEREKERTKAPSAKDLLRLNRIVVLEEPTITEGFNALLQDAYDGVLTLNEYVYLIVNSYYIRHFHITVPSKIDWDKVCAGIKIRFRKNIEQQDNENYPHNTISDDILNLFNDNEVRAYDLIKSFREGNRVVYASNRKLYIDGLREQGVMTFSVCKSKRFDVFDKNMAQATADCFDKCSQADKADFASYFMDVWKHCNLQEDLQPEKTKAGFQKLIEVLQKLEAQYKDAGRPIAATHASNFAQRVEELIKMLDDAEKETSSEGSE